MTKKMKVLEFEVKFDGNSTTRIELEIPIHHGLSQYSQIDVWLLAARKAANYNGKLTSITLIKEDEYAIEVII